MMGKEPTTTDKRINHSHIEWKNIFNAIGHPAFILDPKHTIIAVNSMTLELSGKPETDILGKKCYELFHVKGSLAPVQNCPLEKMLRSNRFQTVEMETELFGGFYLVSSTPVFDRLGNLDTIVHIATDITQRKKSEDALRETEERFRILLNKSFDGIFIHDNFIILDINQRMADILGYSVTELLHTSMLDRVTPNSQRLIQEYIRSRREGYFELELLKKDGKIVNVETFGSPCRFQGKNARIVAIRDITEQKKLQEQLRQAQKMEAIGHLAGGVAHDFNNILSAIIGYAHLTMMKLKSDDPLRMNIEHILSSSERAANLTRSLLAFSRKQLIIPKPVNINHIVLNIKKILDRIIGEDIDLKVIFDSEDLIVTGDRGQIEHALMNLATNARDAMPGGGALTMTIREVEVDDKFIQMHKEGKRGTYASITVSDTGIGMDKKTIENIFEPFFTTKEVGKGTGLGLAMVYGTIKQHNGFINVYSEPGEGTTFNIYLPLVEPGVEHTETNETGTAVSGIENVLLIEDNQAVRKSIRDLLQEFGYNVMDAADGGQAIALFKENMGSLHLVISDVIMPGQSGKEVYEELKKERPDIKMLFVSGYSADILTKKGIMGEKINFISKPINPDVFLKKVREILDN